MDMVKEYTPVVRGQAGRVDGVEEWPWGLETTEPDGGQPDVSVGQPLRDGGGRNGTKPESSRVLGQILGQQ